MDSFWRANTPSIKKTKCRLAHLAIHWPKWPVLHHWNIANHTVILPSAERNAHHTQKGHEFACATRRYIYPSSKSQHFSRANFTFQRWICIEKWAKLFHNVSYVGKCSSQLQVISGDSLVLLTLKFVPKVLRWGWLESGASVEGIPSQQIWTDKILHLLMQVLGNGSYPDFWGFFARNSQVVNASQVCRFEVPNPRGKVCKFETRSTVSPVVTRYQRSVTFVRWVLGGFFR